MSWNFGNSLSGGGSGHNLGNLHGNIHFAPKFEGSGGSVQPFVGRAGELNNLNTKTGVNYGGVEIVRNINNNPNTQVFANGMRDSIGNSQFGVGFSANF